MVIIDRTKEVIEVKTLLKYHSTLNLLDAGSTFNIDAAGGVGFNEGWRKLDGISFVSERIIDLAGLAVEDETVFFEGITIQEGSMASGANGGAGDGFVIMDVVSTVPLDVDNDYGKYFFHGIGFPNGGMANFEHIPFCRSSRYTIDLDTAGAFAFKAAAEQSGSLEPTASDRLYVYRFLTVVNFSTTMSGITVAPARLLCAVSTREEPDHTYLMRLKRSYDLQNEPDVDRA